MAQWLRGSLRERGQLLLANDDALVALELDAKAVSSLLGAHLANELQEHTALWSVSVLLQFYKTEFESIA